MSDEINDLMDVEGRVFTKPDTASNSALICLLESMPVVDAESQREWDRGLAAVKEEMEAGLPEYLEWEKKLAAAVAKNVHRVIG